MKKLVFAVAALGMLLLGFWLVILFLTPEKKISEVSETARPAAGDADGSEAPAQVAVLEPPAEAATQKPAGALPAASLRSAAEPLPAVQLVGDWKSSERRVVRGSVVQPAGVPEDPTLSVFALSRNLKPEELYGSQGAVSRFARSRAGFDDHAEGALVRLASGDGDDDDEANANGDGADGAPPAPMPSDLAGVGLVAVAPVAADGSFELPFPPDHKTGWIAVDGRYLYTSEPVLVELETARDVPVVPEVGAWLTGSIVLPTDAADPATTYRGTAVELSVDTSQINIFDMGGRSNFYERVAAPNAEGRFEFRGVGANLVHQASVRCETLAHQVVKGLSVGDGKDRHVEIELVHGARIAGRVVDESGAPVAKARVRAGTGSLFGFAVDRVGSTMSGDDGAFELAHVHPGKVQFIVRKDTYLDSKPQTLELKDREEREDMLLTLSRGASIGGRLTFADGSPGAELEVDVSFDPAALGSMAAFNAARGADGDDKSDAAGAFVVTGLGKGPFVVSATTKVGEKGYAARVAGVKPDTLDLALVLKPEPTLSGFVMTAEGAPLPSFNVRAEAESQAFWLGTDSEQKDFEDPTGAFELIGLKEGKWRVQATAKGWSTSGWESLTLPLPEGSPPLKLVLTPEALAAGRVVDPDGRPVPGATVRPQLDLAENFATVTGQVEATEARTAEEGLFSLGGLTAGSVTLVATHPDWVESEPVSVDVTSGHTTDGVELRLRLGGVLTGMIYNQEGKPAAGATVFIQNTTNFMPLLANAEPDGTFRRESVKPGKWQVTAMLGGLDSGGLLGGEDDEEPDMSAFLSGMRTDVATIEEGKETHVVLGAPPADPVKVTGLVMHADGPVEKAMVTMFPEGAVGIGAMKFTTTNEEGKFDIALDHPGKYMMSVQIIGERAMAQDTLEFPQVIPEAEEHHIKVELPGGRISGTVYGVEGKPAADMRVSLTVDGGIGYGSFMGGRYVEMHTDADGRFEIGYMSAGEYSISAGGTLGGGIFGGSAEAGRIVKSGIALEDGEWVKNLDFRLHAPCQITGRVVDVTGSPVKEAAVFVRDEGGHVLERFSMTSSDELGRFTYTGVAPGRYTVHARTGELASAEGLAVEVQEGGSNEALITVDAGTLLKVSVVDDLDEVDGVVDARITVLDDEGRQVNGLLSYQDILNSTSQLYSTEEVAVGPLSAGRYTVTATADDGRTVTKPVTLNGQHERKLKIRLK